jgi:RNA polymerase sigma factor (sigma-70 family)
METTSCGTGSETHDRNLIRGILDGDEACFRRLYERYSGRIFAYALRRVGSTADAEDIAQEVFLQLHRSLPSYQARSSFSTWIFGIAHNVTCRHFRRAARTPVCLEDETLEACLRHEPSAEQQLDAARAVERCDESLARSRGAEHVEIFHLFYAGGRPVRQIAKRFGKPTQAIKDSLRRSRRALLRDVPELGSSMLAPSAS